MLAGGNTMPIIAPYKDDDGEAPRPCERAVLTSGKKCTAAIILRDENDKHHFLCRSHAAQHLSGNQDLLAGAVIELALTMSVSTKAWESAG
jgi:hypothetical protein